MLRAAFCQRDPNSSSTPGAKRARVRAAARVEYSLEKYQFDAMMDALGLQTKSVMQGLLDSHRAPKPLLVPADTWREYLGALSGVRSDQAAREIETVALRQQLDKEIALRRDAEHALRRVTVCEAEPGFSAFAIRALCDDTPEGRGGVLPPLGFSEAIAKLSRGEVVAPSVVAETWDKLGAFMTSLGKIASGAQDDRQRLLYLATRFMWRGDRARDYAGKGLVFTQVAAEEYLRLQNIYSAPALLKMFDEDLTGNLEFARCVHKKHCSLVFIGKTEK